MANPPLPSDVRRFERPIGLRNRNCPYCGVELSREGRTREHVIGKSFVPRALLADQWNMILWACQKCNWEKSQLEDDISAITLLPGWEGFTRADSEHHIKASRQKASGSTSRRTGKLVKDSVEKLSVTGRSGPLEMSFELVAPPAIDEVRAFQLARMHMMAIFYLTTFNEASQRGGFWPGPFMGLQVARRHDWGNTLMRGFMATTGEWELIAHATTADGFFKLSIRRHPSAELWSGAVEWNKSHRVIAVFGVEGRLDAFTAALPEPEMKVLMEWPKRRRLRYREDVPLAEEDDRLFDTRELL
jgi:hypothetical protein